MATKRNSAQVVMLCNECSRSPKKDDCKKCGTKLCQSCANEHICSHKVDFDFPSCKHHQQISKKYCRLCKIPLCSECKRSGLHNYHKITDIIEIYRWHRGNVKEDLQELETSLYPQYNRGVSEIGKQLAELPQNHEELITSILKQKDAWHEKIEVLVKTLIDQAENMKIKNLNILQQHLSEMTKILSNIRELIQKNRDILKSNDIERTINYDLSIDKYRSPIPNIIVTPLVFEQMPVPMEQISKMFGVFTIPRNEILKKAINTSLQVKIKTGYRTLNSVICNRSDRIWVAGDIQSILCFTEKGSLLDTVVATTETWPHGIALTRQRDLVYTTDNSISLVQDCEIKEMVRLRDCNPGKMCLTASGDLLISIQKRGYPSRIARYTDFIEKSVIRFDDNGKNLFSSGELFLTENQNEDICVSDSKAKTVVVLNRQEKFRFLYKGRESSEKYKSFTPRGIVTDREGHILVTDFHNHVIHIIDNDGHFIQYIDNCNLNLPCDLSINENDQLFVAEWKTGEVAIIQLESNEHFNFD